MSQRDRSESSPAGVSSAGKQVHVTFSFHCALVRLPDKRRTDVLLAPGLRHGVSNGGHGAHGNGGATNGTAATHKAEHIASLRIPRECVSDDRAHRGTQQVTTRLDRAEDTDVTWRLEKYDVTLRTGGQFRNPQEPPANIGLTTAVDDVTYVVPNFPKLADLEVDPACYADGNGFPKELRKGARVRLTGGTIECGVPSGPLKNRRWKVGTAENVGLSDRMEYRKDLDEAGAVELIFRKFDDPETDVKTVYLTPDKNGVVRIHVSNDPFVDDPPQGSKELDPCSTLRHFASYSLLLFPAGKDKSDRLTPPIPLPLDGDEPLLVSEGNTACCPCGGDGNP